jgi:superfamily II DNA or RNA helicase
MSVSELELKRRLIEELRSRPGQSVWELSVVMRSDKSSVNRALYGHPKSFEKAGASPPSWHLTAATAAPTVVEIAKSRAVYSRSGLALAGAFDETKLYDWQRAALDAWRRNGRRGIVEAASGASRSNVGLAAISETLCDGGRVAIVVPTLVLCNHWHALVRTTFPRARVGVLAEGEVATLVDNEILIATTASARYHDFGLGQAAGLLIADECHAFGAVKSRLVHEVGFVARLGLIATCRRTDGVPESLVEPYFEGLVFELGGGRTVDDGPVARFRTALFPDVPARRRTDKVAHRP